MPSQKKVTYVEKIQKQMEQGKAFYFTDFTGLSVKDLESLRRTLKKNNGQYLVIKNTLGLIAMKNLGYDEMTLKQLFVGPTGIAIAFDDPIVLAKTIAEAGNLKIKGGIIEGVFCDQDEVIRFSKIPSRDVLYAQVVGSLNILGNFVGVLEALLRNLMSTINALKEKKDKEEK